MTARILDGKAIAAQVREGIAARANALVSQGTQPCLAVILVGADPASTVYVRNKVAACEKSGIRSLRFDYAADATQDEVIAKIAELNADPAVHGILVQLPLPAHFDARAVLAEVALAKDVDGFHAENVGRLSQGQECFIPCTPHGVMKMLETENVAVEGANAVVIGRSNIVGKPMTMLLINAGATVTVCHSKTRDLAAHVRRADIVVAAVGRAGFVTADMVKPGAVVVDVGINRIADGPDAGKLCGDVDFTAVREVASLVSPVPGGVGPMTITMLLENTLVAAERAVREGYTS